MKTFIVLLVLFAGIPVMAAGESDYAVDELYAQMQWLKYQQHGSAANLAVRTEETYAAGNSTLDDLIAAYKNLAEARLQVSTSPALRVTAREELVNDLTRIENKIRPAELPPLTPVRPGSEPVLDLKAAMKRVAELERSSDRFPRRPPTDLELKIQFARQAAEISLYEERLSALRPEAKVARAPDLKESKLSDVQLLNRPQLESTPRFRQAAEKIQLGAGDHGRAEIKKLVARAFKSLNEHDAEAWSELFKSNGELTDSVGQVFRGREAIRDYQLRAYQVLAPPTLKDSIWRERDTRIGFIRPGIAVVNIRWMMWNEFTPEGNVRDERRGLMTWVVVEEDGEWTIATMNDMDLPLSLPDKYPTIPRTTSGSDDSSRRLPADASL